MMVDRRATALALKGLPVLVRGEVVAVVVVGVPGFLSVGWWISLSLEGVFDLAEGMEERAAPGGL